MSGSCVTLHPNIPLSPRRKQTRLNDGENREFSRVDELSVAVGLEAGSHPLTATTTTVKKSAIPADVAPAVAH
jgi:hypothetical protein